MLMKGSTEDKNHNPILILLVLLCLHWSCEMYSNIPLIHVIPCTLGLKSNLLLWLS